MHSNLSSSWIECLSRKRAILTLLVASLLLLTACGSPPEPTTPTATSQSLETREDTPLDIALVAEDPEGDALTYEIVDAPDHGTLEGEAPALTYVPDAHFLGSDSFAFVVSDGERSSAEAEVAVDVLNTPYFVITRGSADVSSLLYRVDERGRAHEIGDTGHALIAIKVDPADGTLYGTTRFDDTAAACDSCLVTIDPTTAEVTVVGPLDHDGDPTTIEGPVASLGFTADGTLYGWSENGDDAVRIDTETGATTVLGDSGLSSYGHGMFVDEDDTIWLINGNGYVYTIDPADGSLTAVHAGEDVAEAAGVPYIGDYMVRGDRDPATGKYWGVSTIYGSGPAISIARMRIDADTATTIDVAPTDAVLNVHNLAFVH